MAGRIAVVIGGGVVGVTTAVGLAHRGMKVTLLERSRTLASASSARNGGQLSYCYVDPLAAPSILRDLPRLLFGFDPAFRIHPHLSPGFLRWALNFLENCTSSRFDANTRAILRLALRSRSALATLRARYAGLEFGHTASGKLHIYDDVKKFEIAKAAVQLKNEFGCGQRVLQMDELLTMEPAFSARRSSIIGAIYSPIDEAGDPQRFTQRLAAYAVREHGLDVSTSTAVDQFVFDKRRIRAVRTPHGLIEGDVFVLAAGCDSSALASRAGLVLPLYPMKGYSVTLPATRGSPTISITDTRAKIVFCRLQEQVRIAGMAELGRADDSIDPCRIGVILEAARTCLPEAADWLAHPNPWSGLRSMTPDCRPIIGATRVVNLFLNCGHGMLGWTLACGSAELIADLIVNECPQQHLVHDFSCARFGGELALPLAGATTDGACRAW